MELIKAQYKLLSNFCSDVAKGALLSGLGFSYVITTSPMERLVFLVSGIVMAGIMLYLALLVAKNIKE